MKLWQRINLTFFMLFCIVLSMFLDSNAQGAMQVAIVANPGPFAAIEEAAVSENKVNWWDDDFSDDRACTESFAATELAKYLIASSVADANRIELTSKLIMPDADNVFLIGSRQSNPLVNAYSRTKKDSFKIDQSFSIRAFRDGARTVTIIEGSDRIGTLYGVYAYLEILGFRFYGLGDKGIVFPKEIPVLPARLDIVSSPSYLTRGFPAWEAAHGNEEFFYWMARNRMNLWTAADPRVHLLKKLGMKLSEGGHKFQNLFLNPQAQYTGDANDAKLTYFEAHPEWFGLKKGKRVSAVRGANFCTSNEDAVKELSSNLINSLIDGQYRYADIVYVWMIDGSGYWCQCENCEKLGSFSDRILKLIYDIDSHLKEAHRDGRLSRPVQLVSLAYLDTITPPTKPLPADFDYQNCLITFFPIYRCYAHTFADKKCTEVNQKILRDYKGWVEGKDRFFKGQMFIGEYYNVSAIKSLPVLYSRVISADIPWYYNNGARHFNYMHTPTRLWGTWTLNQYLLGRLLWDHKADSAEIIDEYFRLYYPTASQTTRQFYQHLEDAMANIKVLKHYVLDESNKDGRYSPRMKLLNDKEELFPFDHIKYDVYKPKLNDGPDVVEIVDLMRLARKDIDAALLECTDETEKLRLAEDERRFEYGELMTGFQYHLIRVVLFHRSGDEALASREFQYLDIYANRLKQIVDLVQVSSSHGNAKDGLEASYAQPIYEELAKRYGSFNEDK